ncbi:MAG TPA: NAD-dependent succinate-semialdehyde dehydrogenase [Chryseosolibacter sp.]|nr:NAD-dependent succinate-semialdehyde dehydrogenase [Chryseosolibacter sp.]
MLKSINPFNQSLVAEYQMDTAESVDRKLKNAMEVFVRWRKLSFSARTDLMLKAKEILVLNKEQYARIISIEMGKVLHESIAEVEKCAEVCGYFAMNAEQMLRDHIIQTEAIKSFVAWQPLGPVLAIMPWNFPFWQVFRFAAPALMAGNVGMLKHASNVTGCSLAIQSVFREAGFPDDVFQALLVGSKDVEKIIERGEVMAVTLTGSEYAGTQVAAAAGKNLKKTVLELGGSDPFIVLKDADISHAAKIGSQSRMRNAGQSCIAAKRFIVVKEVKDEFVQKMIEEASALKQGDQFLAETTTGPLARLDLAIDVEKQMLSTIKKGASLLIGGQRNGCNFVPAVVDNVSPGMPGFDEELFGPVASIIIAKDESDAVRLANQNRYGLGASVWTRDRERGERVAREIESGNVFVNSLMRSDQRLPFGGIKKSGYGRELSELGIREFMNPKTIFIA